MTQCLDPVSERVRESLKEGVLLDNKCLSSAEADSGGLQLRIRALCDDIKLAAVKYYKKNSNLRHGNGSGSTL